MKRLLLFLFATTTLAGTTATQKPGDWALKKQGDQVVISRHASLDECVKASPAGKYKCDTSVALDVAQNCEGEKPPKLYLSKETTDGTEYWVLPGAGWTDDTLVEVANLYVHGPSWPAGYPNCWVRGEAPRLEWRMNSKDEPGKAFMELRTPDMPAGDLIADEPNDETPAGTPPGFQEEYHTLAAEAVRHETCVCYSDDLTACPEKCPT
ncbi:MAG TPA: hypothetical protein VN612_10575 [Acidobacteriaceae bacterium]|nr:hypothetical protein [Acidobacteriaceae bacterium]